MLASYHIIRYIINQLIRHLHRNDEFQQLTMHQKHLVEIPVINIQICEVHRIRPHGTTMLLHM